MCRQRQQGADLLSETEQEENHRIIFKTSSDEDEDNDDHPMDNNDQETSPPVFVDFQSSPLYDCYQFGRLANSTNDFIIPGHLHMGEDGVYTSPVSRWAFRILCERLPPFRSFIFAGGFNDAKVLYPNTEQNLSASSFLLLIRNCS
jgi:hypothetical protein